LTFQTQEDKKPFKSFFDAFSGNTVHVPSVQASRNEMSNFVSSRLKPSMKNNKMPDPKVEVFQINDVSDFPSFDKFKV
jgi:hypothetical protein